MAKEKKVKKEALSDICGCESIHADLVTQVRAEMQPKERLLKSANFLKVMADPTRMRIVAALNCHELCVCDLATVLGMTKSAISHQLRSLREAQLVKNRREGKVVYYALKDEHVRRIFEMGIEHISEE